jgi:hypothetical protein
MTIVHAKTPRLCHRPVTLTGGFHIENDGESQGALPRSIALARLTHHPHRTIPLFNGGDSPEVVIHDRLATGAIKGRETRQSL